MKATQSRSQSQLKTPEVKEVKAEFVDNDHPPKSRPKIKSQANLEFTEEDKVSEELRHTVKRIIGVAAR